jgi:hypothetical protein
VSENIRSGDGGASSTPAFLFDLDGTLVDSVYQHVLAWREALERAGIELSVWRIHRRIGMSGGLLINALLREMGKPVTSAESERLREYHAEAYARMVGQVRPLPGARELLDYLTEAGVPWSIATSGWRKSAQPALDMLGVGPEVTLITRDQCSPPVARGRSALGYCRVGMARTSSCRRVLTGSTRTRTICCTTWTRSACAFRRKCHPERSEGGHVSGCEAL